MAHVDQSAFLGRKSHARAKLTDFLDFYVPPRGLDDRQLAARIDSIADAFARKMPTDGDFAEAVRGVFTRVSDTHEGHTWPSQAAFVLAMPKGGAMRAAAETYRPESDADHYAGAMSRGEGVPEAVLWGTLAGRLPVAELDRYRSASVLTWIDTYGQDAPVMMRSRFGTVVDAYFPAERAKG